MRKRVGLAVAIIILVGLAVGGYLLFNLRIRPYALEYAEAQLSDRALSILNPGSYTHLGTRAVAMSGQVPMAIRKARAAEVAQIGAETAQRYLEGFVGKRELVLLEELLPDGRAVGHNERYCICLLYTSRCV